VEQADFVARLCAGWDGHTVLVHHHCCVYNVCMVSTLSAEREHYVRALERDLNSLIEQLSGVPEVQKVVLFGSYAAGR
jgi:hypothetical protein